jgi:hypothetical protein
MRETGFITIAGVLERDTDLLLLEEFIASHDFTSWFVSQIGFMDAATAYVADAKRSVTHSTGESDLEILLIDDAKRSFGILIENKVGAGFQPMQALRYRERAEKYKKAEKFSIIEQFSWHQLLTFTRTSKDSMPVSITKILLSGSH